MNNSFTPKRPKRPSWSIWRHKKEGWITFYLEGHLEPEMRWDPIANKHVKVLPKVKADEFENINPSDYIFKASLKFTGLYLGRSAVNFEFKSLETGEHYIMLPKEFERVFKNSYFHKGVISGLWRFQKCGSTIGVCLIKELDDDDEPQNDNSFNPV